MHLPYIDLRSGRALRPKPAGSSSVAEKPQRGSIDCHNLHGVKQRGISASKVLRRSSDRANILTDQRTTTRYNTAAYLFRSKAHDSCYPGRNPG